MKREQIERLAMDRAAGELNPDAEALLQEYLAEHSETLEWANDITELYDQVQTAISSKTGKNMENERAILSYEENRPYACHWKILVRAAVVIFAVMIGVGIGRFSQPDVSTSESGNVIYNTRQADIRKVADISGTEGGFWRKRALASLQTRPYRNNESSQVTTGFWNRFKPSLKENNYD